MLIALLLSFAGPTCKTDSTPDYLTINELKVSGSIQKIKEISTFSFLGPTFRLVLYDQEESKKKTIGFSWDLDSLSYSKFDKIEKAACAFSDMINIYFLEQKQLHNLDEIMLLVTRDGDSAKCHSFNFLIDSNLKDIKYPVDQKIKLLKDISLCDIQCNITTDEYNSSKAIMYLTMIVPDVVVKIENNLNPLKDALIQAVDKFILSDNREYYSKYQLTFAGQHVKKEFTIPISKPQNETL